ncbi:hypothetical protein K461DRAFT_271991 [Myriangium duriaei CBS 260.36]|uniref:2EXR domain-containing protein n=1 Tax=Myriangium duriaei CBS 260.36 TaxID=1168546 RepID=A0A9P4IX65_9PEZI|nr:hypothetical protein K461DRAFT_271991 [Myriangium duriaei CBS 260.36]
MTTPFTFPQFPRLPPEIRLMIWHHALPSTPAFYQWVAMRVPRRWPWWQPLSLMFYRRASGDRSAQPGQDQLDVIHPLPSTVSVNHEAREATLEWAVKRDEVIHLEYRNVGTPGARDVFTFEADSRMLYFRSDWCQNDFRRYLHQDERVIEEQRFLGLFSGAASYRSAKIAFHEEALVDGPLLRFILKHGTSIWVACGSPAELDGSQGKRSCHGQLREWIADEGRFITLPKSQDPPKLWDEDDLSWEPTPDEWELPEHNEFAAPRFEKLDNTLQGLTKLLARLEIKTFAVRPVTLVPEPFEGNDEPM